MASVSPQELILNQARVIVTMAAKAGEPVYAGTVAKRLHAENPQAGMSEREISELLVQLAVKERVPVDTTV